MEQTLAHGKPSRRSKMDRRMPQQRELSTVRIDKLTATLDHSVQSRNTPKQERIHRASKF